MVIELTPRYHVMEEPLMWIVKVTSYLQICNISILWPSYISNIP